MTKQIPTPPVNDRAAERKLVALAFKQAEKQLEEGTASSQVLTHFLKLGSLRAKAELAKIELDAALVEEKILAEQSGQQIQAMVKEVLFALKGYSPPAYTRPPTDSELRR